MMVAESALRTMLETAFQSLSSRGETVAARRPGVISRAAARLARRTLYWQRT